MYLRTRQIRKSKNWSSNRKSSKCHICGSLQIYQLIQVCKFAGLPFADRPPLEIIHIEENPGTYPIIFLSKGSCFLSATVAENWQKLRTLVTPMIQGKGLKPVK
jgi:hypothetical protein